MTTQDRLNFLMDAYAQQNISSEDYAELMVLLKDPIYDEGLSQAMDAVWGAIQTEDLHKAEELNEIYNNIISNPSFKQNRRVWFLTRPWITTIAATIAMIVIGGAWFYTYHMSANHRLNEIAIHNQQINPGSNRASLTLANGRVIHLSGAKKGVVIGNNSLSYDDGTTVNNENQSFEGVTESVTASTPRGGTYEFILPDGSRVWLNAATVLKFPVSFLGMKSRIVELKTGEAYFEIAKDAAHPFIVKSPGQELEVLGTHFNISAYTEDGALRSTLMEGAVKINQRVFLKPGQQSVLKNDKIEVEEVDVDAVAAWKNGEFVFNSNDFEATMNMIARWYDVEIIYDYKPVNLHLAGQLSRKRSIAEVLKRLQETEDVKFKIEGRRIRVIK